MVPHPCLSCGACCAAYRVTFHESEHEDNEGRVPAWITERHKPWHLSLRGTTGDEPRCAALEGAVGESVRCRIYPRRPSPCQDFWPSWENGKVNPFCDEARFQHGLEPLSLATWGLALDEFDEPDDGP